MKAHTFQLKTALVFSLLILMFFSCKKEQKTQDAGRKMQEMVIAISQTAKAVNPNFIIIPQNGVETIFNDVQEDKELNFNFINAIDAYGNEELFYNGKPEQDDYKLNMLRQLKPYKPVLVAEYVSSSGDIPDAIQQNTNEGFICFPRSENNYHYKEIPAIPSNESANSITSMDQVKNYLYLINSENYSSKSDFLNAISQTNYDLVIIDLFFEDEPFTSQELNQIRTKANGGSRLLICYMNIGSAEKFRYYWQSDWKLHNPKWIKKKYEGYSDEFWVQFWDSEWQNILFGNSDSYLSKIQAAQFDGVYLDNIEAFYTLYHKK